MSKRKIHRFEVCFRIDPPMTEDEVFPLVRELLSTGGMGVRAGDYDLQLIGNVKKPEART